MNIHLLVQIEYPDGGLTAPVPMTVQCESAPPKLEVKTAGQLAGDVIYPGEKVWSVFSVDGLYGLGECTLIYQCTPSTMANCFSEDGGIWTAPEVKEETPVMLIYYVQREDGAQSGAVGVPVRILPALKEE